jgi:hypothetical protein
LRKTLLAVLIQMLWRGGRCFFGCHVVPDQLTMLRQTARPSRRAAKSAGSQRKS